MFRFYFRKIDFVWLYNIHAMATHTHVCSLCTNIIVKALWVSSQNKTKQKKINDGKKPWHFVMCLFSQFFFVVVVRMRSLIQNYVEFEIKKRKNNLIVFCLAASAFSREKKASVLSFESTLNTRACAYILHPHSIPKNVHCSTHRTSDFFSFLENPFWHQSNEICWKINDWT